MALNAHQERSSSGHLSRSSVSRCVLIFGGFFLVALSVALGCLLPLTSEQQKMDSYGPVQILRVRVTLPWGRLSSIIGWIYFCAWTASFYPQVFAQLETQKVEGLSTDYQVFEFNWFWILRAL